MSFQGALNEYITTLSCSARELALASGLSEAAISRYRSGRRVPPPDSLPLRQLADGLAAIARIRGRENITPEGVRTLFAEAMQDEKVAVDPAVFSARLNALLDAFQISGAELAHALSFDPSYLSRIRHGQRRPSDVPAFTRSVGLFLARRCRSEGDREKLYSFLGIELPAVRNDEACAQTVAEYLSSQTAAQPTSGYVTDFLQKVDSFDIDTYMRIHPFDELAPPTAPVALPPPREYNGLREIMDGQIDFLKLTVLSHTREPVVMYSDYPMDEMADDPAFVRDWMFGVVTILKKGLHLHMIHNVERPFHEMLLCLESYIPLYMTGQISPYYLPGLQANVFGHLLWVSGAASLSGECIMGHLDDGRAYLTNRTGELAYNHRRAAQLLEKAQPLIEIYREDRAEEFMDLMREDARLPGKHSALLSSLPVYTLSDELAGRVLTRCGVPGGEKERILAFIASEKARMTEILSHSAVSEVLPLFTREEFEAHPMAMSLSGIFDAEEILYTWEEYEEHLDLCDAFAREHKNYRCLRHDQAPYRHIQIAIHDGEWVLISKARSPVVHFVLRHPKMRDALRDNLLSVFE